MANRDAQRELESLLPDDFPVLGLLQQIYTPGGMGPREYISTGIFMLVVAPAALAAALFITPDNPSDAPIMKGVVGAIAAGLGIGGAVMLGLGLKRRGRWFTSGVH
jgi:hypothetical protein